MTIPNDYQKAQAACTCLKPARRAYIKGKMDFAADFPDGAFLAFMAESGVDVSELEPFAEGHKCPPDEACKSCGDSIYDEPRMTCGNMDAHASEDDDS